MGSATTVPAGVASWQREGLAASVEGGGGGGAGCCRWGRGVESASIS